MKIALRCAKCREIWLNTEDQLMLEIDFETQRMTCFCPKCKHENVLDFMSWQKKQKHSALPGIGVVH
jgi:phage FluMu protein Com